MSVGTGVKVAVGRGDALGALDSVAFGVGEMAITGAEGEPPEEQAVNTAIREKQTHADDERTVQKLQESDEKFTSAGIWPC